MTVLSCLLLSLLMLEKTVLDQPAGQPVQFRLVSLKALSGNRQPEKTFLTLTEELPGQNPSSTKKMIWPIRIRKPQQVQAALLLPSLMLQGRVTIEASANSDMLFIINRPMIGSALTIDPANAKPGRYRHVYERSGIPKDGGPRFKEAFELTYDLIAPTKPYARVKLISLKAVKPLSGHDTVSLALDHLHYIEFSPEMISSTRKDMTVNDYLRNQPPVMFSQKLELQIEVHNQARRKDAAPPPRPVNLMLSPIVIAAKEQGQRKATASVKYGGVTVSYQVEYEVMPKAIVWKPQSASGSAAVK